MSDVGQVTKSPEHRLIYIRIHTCPIYLFLTLTGKNSLFINIPGKIKIFLPLIGNSLFNSLNRQQQPLTG